MPKSRRSPPAPRAYALIGQAVGMLVWMLPRPHNFNTSVGRGMRKLRLGNELTEFDLLHRLKFGKAARLEQLYCAGMLLLASCKGRLPAHILPLDEPMLVNPQSFDALFQQVEERLALIHAD